MYVPCIRLIMCVPCIIFMASGKVYIISFKVNPRTGPSQTVGRLFPLPIQYVSWYAGTYPPPIVYLQVLFCLRGTEFIVICNTINQPKK